MPLDTKVLVVARDAPDGHRKAPRFLRVEIVIAARLLLTDAKRVTHQVTGDEDEIRTMFFRDRPQLLQAIEALRTDMRVGRVDEGERSGSGVRR
jgi:hypothetical protein